MASPLDNAGHLRFPVDAVEGEHASWLPILPPGTEPPVRPREAAPDARVAPDPLEAPDPWATAAALSVTPPPPRRYSGFGSTDAVRITAPPPAAPVHTSPPPRAPREVAASSTAHTQPPPRRRAHASPRSTATPVAARSLHGAVTQPAAPNRTGPTDGSSPSRARPGEVAPWSAPGAPMSYAPPWGGGAGWSAQPTPIGAPRHATPAAAQPLYGTWMPGTPPPVPPGVTPAPWAQRTQPQVVLGLEGPGIGLVLGVVLCVGLVGALLGVGASRLLVPPPAVRAPLVVAPTPALPLQPTAPRWQVEPPLPQLQVRPLQLSDEPAVPAEPAPATPPPVPRAPFSVESSDVRDPWGG